MRKIKHLLTMASGAYIGFVLLLIHVAVPFIVFTSVLVLIVASIAKLSIVTPQTVYVSSYVPLAISVLLTSMISGIIVLVLIRKIIEKQAAGTRIKWKQPVLNKRKISP